MPIAIIVGTIFYKFFAGLSFLTPYLIFTMLFLTYCNLKFKEIRVSPLHLWLVLIQMFGSLAVYFVISPFNVTIAQGAMVCVLAPTGTAAPVITGMLKGNVASLTAYSLLSNLCVLVAAPFIFSLVGRPGGLPFFESVLAISQKVVILLLGPFLLALILRKFLPAITTAIGKVSGLSFYIWTLALCVVTGRTVEFILKQNATNHSIEILVALAALVVCIVLYTTGRGIGSHYDDTIAGGQGLGQKNTILAIWMAQMYLNPISSIAPGAYVLWQNMFNSWQVWRKRKSL